ncbi:MAG TPA: hypothetical protein VE263_21305 [Candidatus Angelobacter sp.]|nr:hypothetical protein [Candidatus Angelobacter sp.]
MAPGDQPTVSVADQVAAPIREKEYGVKPEVPKPRRKVAIIVNHGMGQQVPFETLELVAKALWNKEPAATRRPIVTRMVRLGTQDKPEEKELPRAEVQLTGKDGPVEAHLYEAYWAPLTEGKVSLTQVIWFLLDAGWNGVRNAASGRFRRWMFGKWQDLKIRKLFLIFIFLIAILTVLALVVVNAMIATAAASHALGGSGSWPPKEQLNVLTQDLFIVFLSAVAIFLGTVFLPMILNWLTHLACALQDCFPHGSAELPNSIKRIRSMLKWIRHATNLSIGWLLVFAGLAGIMVMGVVISLHLAFQTTVTAPYQSIHGTFKYLLPSIIKVPVPYRFTRGTVGYLLLSIVIISAGSALHAVLSKLQNRLGRCYDVVRMPLSIVANCFTLAGMAGLIFIGALGPWHLAYLLANHVWIVFSRWYVAAGLWGIGIGASYLARNVIVEYVGDVTAYVAFHTVSVFWDVRKAILDLAFGVARAVYRARTDHDEGFLYDDIIVLGHSLGSVIAYDVLNGLLVEDRFSAKPLNVAGRTKLFLTFGSPLDKTAFAFRTQQDIRSALREAEAAAKQPMIQSYNFRPQRWINIWSHSDWVSGSLDYYDNWEGWPVPANPADIGKRVINCRDRDANAPLVAHTQYWHNDLFANMLYAAATGDAPSKCDCEDKRWIGSWLLLAQPVNPRFSAYWPKREAIEPRMQESESK